MNAKEKKLKELATWYELNYRNNKPNPDLRPQILSLSEQELDTLMINIRDFKILRALCIDHKKALDGFMREFGGKK